MFRFLPFLVVLSWVALDAVGGESLPSWNDTASKSAIIEFVTRVTTAGSADFVPQPERVAVFDNDGTLWPENPLPFQLVFAIDEIRRLLPDNPSWGDDPGVAAALGGDIRALTADHHAKLLRVVELASAGMTTAEYADRVSRWLSSARHPRLNRRYDQLAYQPMLELLSYLRANGFKTFIVSGGGADFLRVFSERVYGIPPEQVVGSNARAVFELREEGPVLVKTMEDLFVDDREGKPSGIHQFIGRRPIMAFGNSDGDKAMMEYTTIANTRPSLGLILHHTDSKREFAYDSAPTSSGRLVKALADAPERGWVVVDMAHDWKVVFPEIEKP